MSIPAPEPPSITSLPLPDPLAYEGEAREYARALMQRKDAIEREIEVLKDVLSSHNANASTPLVDPEGYPRSDIDVYSIRHVRSNIIRLTTDLKTVNDLLPSALESAFSRPTGPTSASSHGANGSAPSEMNGHEPIASRGSGDMPDEWPSAGIAKVNSVAPHSPAAEAGLQAQDDIYSFGGITSDTGNLQAIGALVAQSEGTAIIILVSRRNERMRLRLTPRTGWGGRGLLGCHILPIA